MAIVRGAYVAAHRDFGGALLLCGKACPDDLRNDCEAAVFRPARSAAVQ
jgi:hypothetical protein